MPGHMSQFETGFMPVRARWSLALLLALLVLPFFAADVLAHNITEGDKGYIQEIVGPHLVPFLYLGAKHMVTGYDHLLFLLGVIFFLYRLKHVAVYVSLFALGHSLTMIAGVYFGWQVNAYLIDAIIGSVSRLQGTGQSWGVPALVWISAGHEAGHLDIRSVPRAWACYQDSRL